MDRRRAATPSCSPYRERRGPRRHLDLPGRHAEDRAHSFRHVTLVREAGLQRHLAREASSEEALSRDIDPPPNHILMGGHAGGRLERRGEMRAAQTRHRGEILEAERGVEMGFHVVFHPAQPERAEGVQNWRFAGKPDDLGRKRERYAVDKQIVVRRRRTRPR